MSSDVIGHQSNLDYTEIKDTKPKKTFKFILRDHGKFGVPAAIYRRLKEHLRTFKFSCFNQTNNKIIVELFQKKGESGFYSIRHTNTKMFFNIPRSVTKAYEYIDHEMRVEIKFTRKNKRKSIYFIMSPGEKRTSKSPIPERDMKRLEMIASFLEDKKEEMREIAGNNNNLSGKTTVSTHNMKKNPCPECDGHKFEYFRDQILMAKKITCINVACNTILSAYNARNHQLKIKEDWTANVRSIVKFLKISNPLISFF
jgi:hypothetical protein